MKKHSPVTQEMSMLCNCLCFLLNLPPQGSDDQPVLRLFSVRHSIHLHPEVLQAVEVLSLDLFSELTFL